MSSMSLNLAFRNKKRSFGGVSTPSSKYGNQKVTIDGIVFDSKKESQRYLFLKEKENMGIISNLECHKTFELIPHQTKTVTETKRLKTKVKVTEKEKVLFLAVKFSPDFVYQYKGQTIAEDVKGSKMVVSKDFPIRQKLLYYYHNIYCNIITKPTSPIPSPI